jgi:ABC-type branched-subunit amino acid transport system ATPase component
VTKLLECRGLDVSYGSLQVLFGVDFTVEEGESVGLLGTNGAGKSTLLRAICGLTPPRVGRIAYDGADITGISTARAARLGIIQAPGGKGIFPGLSVVENLKVAGWLYRRQTGRTARAVDQMLERFPALRARKDSPAATLSGGEQQMVTLAQAFIARPRLLLIDELSLGLAPAIVGELLDVVRTIQAAGVTVVIVEQSVTVALQVCHRAVFMERGSVQYEGPAAELLDRPDLLRAVFLGGAIAAAETPSTDAAASEIAKPRAHVDVAGLSEAGVQLPKLLEATNLTKQFGGIKAVDDVSIAVHSGEIVGIIGANGAGKTTLFDLLSGYLAPDFGRVVLDGTDVTDWSASRRACARLGRSAQDARLFPSLTVREAIKVAYERHLTARDPLGVVLASPASRESERGASARADELAELMGLTGYLDSFVAELSTGTRRIVELACSLAHRPRVLLLDEPSSGIAHKEAEALAPVLSRIQVELGASLVIIDHDVSLLSAVADRLVAMESGRIIATGAAKDVLADPAVVTSYLGGDPATIARSAPQPHRKLRRTSARPAKAGSRGGPR